MKPLLQSSKWWAPVLVLLLSMVGTNLLAVHSPAMSALAEDTRNENVDWAVYHQWGVSPRTIVLDLRRLDQEAAMVDVDRGLFQIAERFQQRNYDRIILAFRGEAKFMLEGAYFRQIGNEYAWQNPVVLLRELPQNTYNLDGSPAFETWTGGLLGVVNAQMQDHEDLHRRWYLDEAYLDFQ